MADEEGGRIFFSNVGRSLEEEDEIRLTSVGVDIGSSTSHLVFSRLVLERLDNRYIVSEREVFHESDVLLTPYADDMTIDAGRLAGLVITDPDGCRAMVCEGYRSSPYRFGTEYFLDACAARRGLMERLSYAPVLVPPSRVVNP